jgi:amino acid transporter
VWAFSRDGAMPFSRVWHKVHPTFNVPVNAVWVTAFLSFLLGLPSLHNTVAFYAVTSIVVIGLNISYGLTIFFKLVFARKTFVRGPFHLGAASDFVGVLAILYICFVTVRMRPFLLLRHLS